MSGIKAHYVTDRTSPLYVSHLESEVAIFREQIDLIHRENCRFIEYNSELEAKVSTLEKDLASAFDEIYRCHLRNRELNELVRELQEDVD